eukprot:1042580-Pyramimonas_sp.AAC.1
MMMMMMMMMMMCSCGSWGSNDSCRRSCLRVCDYSMGGGAAAPAWAGCGPRGGESLRFARCMSGARADWASVVCSACLPSWSPVSFWAPRGSLVSAPGP